MGGMMLSPHRTFFPIYLKELGYSAVTIAAMTTVRRVMGTLASLLGGALSDSFGRKWTFALGQVGFLLGSLVFMVVSPEWIGVLWALSGLGAGLHTLGGQSYLMDAAHRAYLGLLTAFYNWGYTLGGALSSPVAGILLDRWNYRVFGSALTIFALATISVNLFLLPRSPSQASREASSWRKLFGYGDVAARPSVIVLVLLRFLPTVYWGMASVLIPLLLDAAGATKILIASYATISQVVASLAQIVVGRAADRLGVKWPTVVMYVTLVANILGIGALPDRLSSVYAFGTLSTAAAWSLSTLLPSMVAQVTESEERGRTLGWIHLWWNVAMMVGSMAGGALYERVAGLPFISAGALNLLSIALVFAFFRMVARREAAS
jgi:MFS family permease